MVQCTNGYFQLSAIIMKIIKRKLKILQLTKLNTRRTAALMYLEEQGASIDVNSCKLVPSDQSLPRTSFVFKGALLLLAEFIVNTKNRQVLKCLKST